MNHGVGEIIKEWRTIRRFSQLDLSLEANTSARHLSFVESGRANPSRTMVLRLASALQMPRDVANDALRAAGFAPAYPQLAADAPDLGPVRAAVATMLSNHEPYPAICVDRHWDITAANGGAARLFSALGLAGQTNMIEALIAAGESNSIENWEETALLALARARAELMHLGADERLKMLTQRLAGHRRIANGDHSAIDLAQAVIPTSFRVGATLVSMFATIAQFGTVQDVTASEIRVEMMFPADEASRNWFRDD